MMTLPRHRNQNIRLRECQKPQMCLRIHVCPELTFSCRSQREEKFLHPQNPTSPGLPLCSTSQPQSNLTLTYVAPLGRTPAGSHSGIRYPISRAISHSEQVSKSLEVTSPIHLSLRAGSKRVKPTDELTILSEFLAPLS
jgi:hypothetical protein